MIKKINFKKKKKFFCIFFILIFNLISISFVPNFKTKNFDNLKEDATSFIQSSSSGPPDKHFFQYYKVITIDHNLVSGTGSHKNFPVLISILDSDLHDDVQSNGIDIAFANDTAWLDHEIELFDQAYNSTHAQLVAWVRIPSLSTSIDTKITMYYGNSTMGFQENPTGVWNSNYMGVWHLSEVSGGSLAIKDSTTNGNNGTDQGSVELGATGQIGGSIRMDQYEDYINITDSSSLDRPSSYITVSAWTNADYYIWNMPVLSKDEFKNSPYGILYSNSSNVIGYNLEGVTTSDVNSNVSITRQGWMHVVLTYDGSNVRIYKNGSLSYSSSQTGTIAPNNANLKFGREEMYGDWFLGFLDEIRISDSVRSADWIATEFNNQYDPISFYTVGPEEMFDNTPPTYSNLIESSDPLELGETEAITINVSDSSGIFQVKIEFEGSNHSMTNIGGDTWQYDSWTPSSIGNYTYTIWMEDNYNNWNSTIGTIEVIDTTPPTYSDLIESADPLQLGQNETITIKIYDSPGSGVNQTLLEYDSSNHTMIFIGGNTWSWTNWKPSSEEVHIYRIYMQDMQDNWNMTVGNITVITTTAPIIGNLTESADPLELGKNILITVEVYDNETDVSTVLIDIGGFNYTMQKNLV